MKEQGSGCIINTSSVSAFETSDLGIYCVTKAAYVMLTQVMAREWGRWGIRVNAIAPGGIKTRFSEWIVKDPALSKAAVENNALLRWGEPGDVAGVVLFLASDLAQYVTGETVVVDGGQLVGSPRSVVKKASQ